MCVKSWISVSKNGGQQTITRSAFFDFLAFLSLPFAARPSVSLNSFVLKWLPPPSVSSSSSTSTSSSSSSSPLLFTCVCCVCLSHFGQICICGGRTELICLVVELPSPLWYSRSGLWSTAKSKAHTALRTTRDQSKKELRGTFEVATGFFCISPSVSPFQLTAAKRVFIYANQTLHYVRVQRVRPGGPSTKFGKTSRGIGGNVFFIGLCTFRWKKYTLIDKANLCQSLRFWD